MTDGDAPHGTILEGDLRDALPGLAESLRGQVALAYLDPPYNSGDRLEHYADSYAPDDWLALMGTCVDGLLPLLRDDGFLCVQIDDRWQAALTVLLDARLGRANRVNTIVVKMSEASGVKVHHAPHHLPRLKEYLLLYRRTPAARLHPIRVPKSGAVLARYLRYYVHVVEDLDAPVHEWRIRRITDVLRERGGRVDEASLTAFKLAHAGRVVYRTNNAHVAAHAPARGTCVIGSPTGRTYHAWDGREMLFLADHLDEWLGDLWLDVSTINLHREGGVAFPNGKKPEALLRRVIELTTAPGDWVVDPFGGSGTTAAVAHKLGRRWVTIERTDGARTRISTRLDRVVRGEDPNGITEAVGWAGGGRFEHVRVPGTVAPVTSASRRTARPRSPRDR